MLEVIDGDVVHGMVSRRRFFVTYRRLLSGGTLLCVVILWLSMHDRLAWVEESKRSSGTVNSTF